MHAALEYAAAHATLAHPVKKCCLILVASLALAGCSADWYRKSADAQVKDILSERKEETLGYQPRAAPSDEAPTTAPCPPKAAYARIPVTLMPPPATSVMERGKVEVPTGVLGPETKWMTAPQIDDSLVSPDDPDARPGRGWVYGPPAPGPGPTRLDLFGVLEYAVQNSRAYKDQMDDLYISALDVTLQRHLFEPRPFATASYTYTGGQKDVNYQSALTAAATVGVKQKLPYGGEIVAQSLVQFVDAINGNVTNGESANVALSGTVPLLRGAGMVNLEPLIQSERKVIYQVRAFEAYRRSFVVDIAGQYFRLLAQLQSMNNRRLNLRNLSDLTERTEALYAAGRLSFLEVQRSLQAKLVAESALLNSQDNYQSALDDFKVALGMSVEQPLEIIPVTLDVDVPHIEAKEAIDLAFKYRLELQTARDKVDDAQRLVQVAKNSLLPDLNFAGQIQATNEPGQPASHVESRTLTYSAGLTLDLPVDRVAERNTYRASLVTLQRTQRQYEQSQEQVASDVRDSLRAIRNAQTTLLIQRRGIDLAERRLDFSNELLKQGKTQARDVVDSQQSMLDAQDAYEAARSNLQVQVLSYLRNTGLLRVDPKAGALGYAMK